jgi:hypothetical protein
MAIASDLFDPTGASRSWELRTDEHAVRVLLVEESAGCAVLVQQALGHASRGHFEIECIDCMPAALVRLNPDRHDALLLDLGHLDLEPSATLDAAAELAYWLPVIVLTGTQDSELGDWPARGAADAGAEGRTVLQRFARADLPAAILAEIKRHRRLGSQGSAPAICRIPRD